MIKQWWMIFIKDFKLAREDRIKLIRLMREVENHAYIQGQTRQNIKFIDKKDVK